MKAKLLPLYFEESNEREKKEFKDQMDILIEVYGEVAGFLAPQPVGSELPDDIDAVLFPQMFGAVFEHRNYLEQITYPIILLTSRFATVEMWDWEIVAYLREELCLNVFTPYQIEIGKAVMRALAAKRGMRGGIKFLLLQDDPGEGMQAGIFKRLYWWAPECREKIERAFGVELVFKSWKEVNEQADGMSDEAALALWEQRAVPAEGVSMPDILKAVKIYMAMKQMADRIGNVAGIGSNCLNESFFSASTPCLAYDWLFEYDRITWACEADLVSLISKFILHSALELPMMMTNIYPFLVGMAALKHEKSMSSLKSRIRTTMRWPYIAAISGLCPDASAPTGRYVRKYWKLSMITR
jgi:hypothetical protein